MKFSSRLVTLYIIVRKVFSIFNILTPVRFSILKDSVGIIVLAN